MLCLFICASAINAQRTCGNEIKSPKEQAIFNAQVKKSRKDFFQWKKNRAETQRSIVQISIPVHVILVHNPSDGINQGNNLSVDRVLSQIQILNEDFARTNADASSTPSVFAASSTEIDFCLTTYDPEGNPTNGITRHSSDSFTDNETEILAATRWPRDQYLNIWVAQDLGSLLGYAYRPTPGNLPSESVDGVVITGPSFGGPGYSDNPPYDGGRTLTHEVGHWLGLNHVWGGGCEFDDGIDDTPEQDVPNYGCPTHPSPTCDNDGDMFMNYMDYVDDRCMNAFTKDQADYMSFILEGTRNTLLSASASACAPNGFPVVRITSQENILCFGDATGRIEATVTAGMAPYTFSLDGGAALATNIFENLSSGNHTLDVSSSDGKTTRAHFKILEPPALELDVQVLSESCQGANNGSVVITIEGGNPGQPELLIFNQNYTDYQSVTASENFANGLPPTWVAEPSWAFGDNNTLSSEFFQFPQNDHFMAFNDDALGEDHVGAGSLYTDWIDLENETSFIIKLDAYFLDLDYEEADERAIIYISGNNNTEWEELTSLQGIPAWATYTITATDYHSSIIKLRIIYDDGAGWNFGLGIDNLEVNKASFGTFTDLAPGEYTLRVTDSAGCTYDQAVTINDSAPVSISSLETIDPTCSNAGQISVTATSPNGINYYEILGLVTSQDGIFTDLPGGIYTIRAYDLSGCFIDQTTELVSSTDLSINLTNINDLTCFQSNDGSFSIDISAANGFQTIYLNGSITNETIFSNLQAGTYTVLVEDEIGCTSSLEVIINESQEIILETNLNNQTCLETGSIDLSVSGGIPPYSYMINSGSFGPLVPNIPLLAGNYTITITDSLGCTRADDFTIEADEDIFFINESLLNCMSGDSSNYLVQFCTTNGSMASWSLYDNQGVVLQNLDTDTCGVFDLSPYLLNNPDGLFYAIEAMDADGCVSELNSFAFHPVELESNYEAFAQLCDGDLYSFQIYNPQGYESISLFDENNDELNPVNNNEFLLDSEIDYSLMTVDTNGCNGVYVMKLTNTPAPITEIASISNATGSSPGSINFTSPIGIPPFSFSLNGEENSDGVFLSVPAGDYVMTLTDGTGCSTDINFTIEMETGINVLSETLQFNLRPNPVKDLLFIDSFYDKIEQLHIYNTEGQLIQSIFVNELYIQVDVSQFPSGLYFVRLQANGSYAYEKFIVQ